MATRLTALALGFLGLGCLGCSNASGPTNEPELLPLTPYLNRSQSYLDSTRAVIRDVDDWTRVWLPQEPRYDVSEIDFAEEMLVLVAAGIRTANMFIVVDSAFVYEDTIYASVTELDARSCGGLAIETTPMKVYRLDLRSEPVVFVEHGLRELDVCGG